MFEASQFKMLRASLTIDIMRMDDELIQHPMLMQSVTELAADALREHDALKHELDLTVAEVGSRIRKAQTPENGKGPTIAELQEFVTRDKKVIEANTNLENAKQDLAYWRGLADSYRTKGSSLKHLSELIQAGYLAPNSVRRSELSEQRQFKRKGSA